MQSITSASNPKIIETAKLKDKKFRDIAGCYLVEGEKMVAEALSRGMDVQSIFTVDENSVAKSFAHSFVVAKNIFSKLTDTVTPEGILAVVKKPKSSLRKLDRCVILDRIRDPGNLGAIIRTCAAADVTDLFLCGCADAFAPKVVRSTMGGIFCVNIVETNEDSAIAVVKERGIPIVTADMRGNDVFGVHLAQFALVVGSESHGVSQGFRAAADATVSIKMKNIESLNASVALGVILYQLIN